jgi:hypothetical protein
VLEDNIVGARDVVTRVRAEGGDSGVLLATIWVDVGVQVGGAHCVVGSRVSTTRRPSGCRGEFLLDDNDRR